MKSPLLAICCGLLAGPATAAEPKPNILVIVSDDQGYADVGFQGCKDIPTPHLDQLAREGVHCTSGYVSHPFCSPTRAGLMTGRYQQRYGHENNVYYDPTDHREGLPTSEKLLPAFLAEAGYATGWIGKWHLGAAPEFRPLSRGFKETFGFIGGGHRHQNWKVNPATEYLVPIERNGQPVEITQHLTTAFGEEAFAFIRRHPTDPWFLYLAFNAPHTPHEPTAERLAVFCLFIDRDALVVDQVIAEVHRHKRAITAEHRNDVAKLRQGLRQRQHGNPRRSSRRRPRRADPGGRRLQF